MPVTFLICAAGKGQRIKTINPDIPKPLLKLNGKTLLNWSLESLPVSLGDEVIIVGQAADNLEREHLHLLERFPSWEFSWVSLSAHTSGQLETAVLALDQVTPGNSLAIFNCDTYFKSSRLLKMMQEKGWQGLVPCSKESGDAWSFCKVRPNSRYITQVAEKTRIAEWCSVGFYYFKDVPLFQNFALKELREKTGAEKYVAPIYNHYIQAGHAIGLVQAELFKPMGSIDQIRDYWGDEAVA